MRRSFVAVAILSLGGVLSAQTQLVSSSADGQAGDLDSRLPSVSADGRFIVFFTEATTLVNDEPDGAAPDILLRDRLTSAIELVSVGPGGESTDEECTQPHVSDDGQRVVFLRRAQEWADVGDGGPVDPSWSVWVRDRAAQTTLLASIDSAGQPLPGPSLSPAISGDGHRVAFVASWPGASPMQVVVRELDQGFTRLASVDPLGQIAQAACDRPSLSHDGRFVAFVSYDIHLAAQPAAASPAVFVKDLASGALELASVSSAGVAADAGSFLPGISADGQRVVFHSEAGNLVVNDDNGVFDVFVRDLAAGWTARASVASDGTQGSHSSLFGAISPDGRFVAFGSDAPEFAPGDTGPWSDVFLHDLETELTILVSKAADAGFADNHSGRPQVSEGGLLVAFESLATDLVSVDANGLVSDVFVVDLSPFKPLGGAAPGGPQLLATGSLFPASDVDLVIGPAEPHTLALLLVSGTPGEIPFAGGTLFAVPALASLIVAVDSHGEAHVAGHWPAGVAAGLAITLQPIVATPGGLIPGNAVTAITP